ncbi:PIR protein [Plasmodium ovale]|uniref:PIR protein n=1 Tax=Plasmodium ovale TaxID=36330 RepID=A0A1C3KHB1_PLAOA|nr:PIR protein [Plasmodium ovale]
MADTNTCELPSEKYYSELNNVIKAETSDKFCNTEEKLLNKYPILKELCWKLESNLQKLKKEELSVDMDKHCKYLKLWSQYNVINQIESKSTIICMGFLYSVWASVMDALKLSSINKCVINSYAVSTDYLMKWKEMHDYNENYKEMETKFNSIENCKEKYCKYIVDIINVYNEFLHVCAGTDAERCPEYWKDFKENYSVASQIELKCKELYDELGFYKVKMSFEDQDGIYIEQYVSQYAFSFIERMIGYSIKNIIDKTIHYSKYIVLPILLIFLFYFFMKKLSLFGSKIAPKADDMRKMWRNVQGITNPASLLNPMKPPGGGNKMGLPYLPK